MHRKVYMGPSFYKLEEDTTHAYLLWTLVITVTGFPVVAYCLSDLKLLHTGLGKNALTAAMISDTYAWILFTLAVPFCINAKGAIYSVVCTIIFIVFCIFVLHPVFIRFINSKTENDDWNNGQLVFVVMGVLAFSYLTDLLGTHGIVGAFVYGLILPHGKFSDMVMSVSDDFATGFLAPIYFAGVGLRLTLPSIFEQQNWHLTLLVVLLLCVPKILSTMFTGFFFGMCNQEGLALGLIMNTKGAMALIMLNIAWDRGIFSPATYTVITSVVLLMTAVVSPTINIIYKPRKIFGQNNLKTIQKLRADAELRILTCVHNTRQATGMISLIKLFNITRLSPIQVFTLYLVEFTKRGAALVAAHMEKPRSHNRVQNLTATQVELDNITSIFEEFREEHDAARVHTSSVMSNYDTIHEDIHMTANEKHTSLILLPFHKQLSSEGVLETTSLQYRDINQMVMHDAPCSVGIFVDRCSRILPKKDFHILMLFIGGPHDREALAVAQRMAGKTEVMLTVLRFLFLDELAEVDTKSYPEAQRLLSSVMDIEQQKELDDEYVSSFRLKTVNMSDNSISYSEIGVHSITDINTVLNEIENNGCDLYIIGQGNCKNSRVFSNLLEWCDFPELGVMGDIIASKNFSSRSSMLVVQQYGFGGMVYGKDGFKSLEVCIQAVVQISRIQIMVHRMELDHLHNHKKVPFQIKVAYSHHQLELSSSRKSPLDPSLMKDLTALIDKDNELAKMFQRVKDFVETDGSSNFYLKLYCNKTKDPRTYNMPTADEVAALIIGDLDTVNEGGMRYMFNNCQDDMTICKRFEYLDLFITMTCNANWKEIQDFVTPRGLRTDDRPDIVARVFKMKLNDLMSNLKKVRTQLCFRKRRLPHDHILIWLQGEGKFKTWDDIDKSSTTIDEEGYPKYRRRNTRVSVTKKDTVMDNTYVVPYNPGLLVRYQAHINVEYCNKSNSIKYLFKYVNKGPDRVSVEISNRDKDSNKEKGVDEIKHYYDCTYLSP
ncbi:cation/H(+) antiporter 15-like [Lotus japonicus]|uniref:cation/H(+) antiporter 15-like n=1 Tax=Lotus japonicus TaxID=34305 RepID=UPI00258C356E|nr:cation/H(+) antiporter 15-like [Lotus japonicus]